MIQGAVYHSGKNSEWVVRKPGPTLWLSTNLDIRPLSYLVSFLWHSFFICGMRG